MGIRLREVTDQYFARAYSSGKKISLKD